jgi:AsmA protein
LSTNLRYASDGIQTSNLVAVVSGLGAATGSGSISPNNALNYRLLIKLSSSGVGGLATQAMSLLPGVFGSAVSQTTANGIPVTISGTTANPTFTPDMSKLIGGAVTQQKNTQTNSIGKALSGLFHR